MSFFDIFPTFEEAPYSYIIVPIMLVSSVIGFYHKPYFHTLLLHPYEVYRGKRVHTLLTSAFVHRNWLHLLFNLVAVFGLVYDLFGCMKQEYGLFAAMAYSPVVIIFLMIIPNIIQTLIKRNNFLFTAVGSSGLSSGLFGFSFLFFPLQHINHLFIPWIKNAAHYGLYVFVIMILLSSIRQLKINYSLHVTAYIIGSLMALLMRKESIFEIFYLFWD